MEKIKVAELFAGVGGFRIGLERASNKFEIVFSNQWEPETKKQIASEIYVSNFGDKGHTNKNIYEIPANEIEEHTLLVGGFPCQDYSIAKTLSKSEGIEGKKGVLWWQIHRILKDKGDDAPKYLLLENVDRLLVSPAKQRGRDFSIILTSLSDLGYAVEWRVINAAEYGMPQKRKRTYFFAYKKGTEIYNEIFDSQDKFEWMKEKGLTKEAFPFELNTKKKPTQFAFEGELSDVSENFNQGNVYKDGFHNYGIMIDRKSYSIGVKAKYDGERIVLKDVLVPEELVPAEFYIQATDIERWQYLKGAKSEDRTSSNGGKYKYQEGPMSFPDDINKPSRTIITSEGGSAPSRFKHVVQTKDGKLRRLMPIELERLDMFPDSHTKLASDKVRAFLMGNALVVGVIEKLGRVLANKI